MTSPTSTTLPAFLLSLLEGADEFATIDYPEGIEGVEPGIIFVARFGTVNLRGGVGAGQADWHDHGDEAEAIECHHRSVVAYSEARDFLASGGDPIAVAFASQTGMPLEVAGALAPQLRAQIEAQEPIPMPAIGRAQVPVQPVEVDLGPADHTGFYL